MYAYCNNNPILGADSTGTIPVNTMHHMTDGGSISDEVRVNRMIAKHEADKARHAANKRDKRHAQGRFRKGEEQDVIYYLENNKSCWYRIAPVFRVPGEGGALSIGTIFMTEGEKRPGVVAHEYGHTMELLLRGPVRYLTATALPSVITANTIPDKHNGLPYEVIATMGGGAFGVGFEPTDAQKAWAIVYALLVP